MAGKFNDVAALFDLEQIGDNLFRSPAPQAGFGRVFGGQVIAQTLIAACRTVKGRMPHSLHAYFILPGSIDEPIDFEVDRLRDGRSFTTRRVTAIQFGKVIYSTIVSFQAAEDGFTHQAKMPDVPQPETLDDHAALRAKYAQTMSPALLRFVDRERPFDMRFVELERFFGKPREGPINVWFKLKTTLPTDNPLYHRFALAFVSDMALIDVALSPHGRTIFEPAIMAASLDHALWFHRDGRIDDWVLYHQDSPNLGGGRGLARGLIFSRDGTLLASVAQEGLLRLRRD
jgi:acyl-CoA thioesterase-2